MNQYLYNANFNLRERKVNKPTNIYCVVYMNGRQYRFSTGVKVLPYQWDMKKQIAVISNIQSVIDNHNNKVVNNKLNELKESFNDFLEYLCNSDDKPSYNLLRSFMCKTPNIMPKELILKAYDYKYHGTKAHENYKSRLNAFIKYLTRTDKSSLDVFTQAGFNEYVKFLKDKGTSKSAINANCQLIERLISKVLAVESPFIEYKISSIVYNKEKDIRLEKGRFALTDDEVNKIEDLNIEESEMFSFKDIAPKEKNGKINYKYCSHKKGKELIEYRDIFILQCRCGQRVSDLVQFLEGNVNMVVEGGQTFYELKTKKSQGKESAFILQDKYIKDFQAKYAKGFTIDISKLDSSNSYYNLAIKKLCKLANINRIISYRNSQDKECKQPIYEKITSHDARHTFITSMLRKSFAPDKLCWLTGHSDDTMIKQVYSHLTSNDKAKALAEETGKMEDYNMVNTKRAALQYLFAYDQLKELEAMKDGNVNILPMSSNCIEVIKDTRKLKKAVQLMKLVSKDKQEEFIRKVKDIDKIIWYIGKHTADTNLYNIYEYKCKRLGIIDKVTDVDLLNQIWQQELYNEELEFYSDETLVGRYEKER